MSEESNKTPDEARNRTLDDVATAQREQELELKKAEVALKQREVEAKGKGMAILQLGLWGALVTAITGLLTTSIQGCNNRAAQEREHLATLAQEREQLQSALIQKAISGLDEEKAAQNLKFLWQTGLLMDDPAAAQEKLAAYIKGLDDKSSTLPVFPAEPSPTSEALGDALRRLLEVTDDTALNKVLEDIKTNATKRATGILASQLNTGELVLPPDYFLTKSEKEYVNKLTVRDTQLYVQAAVIVADAMVNVTKESHPDSDAYLSAWKPKKRESLEKLIFLTSDGTTVWAEFLDEWQNDAITADSKRFREALFQAAYSILRMSLHIEAEHVLNVQKRMGVN